MAQLNVRPHRSIEDEDAFTQCFEIWMQLAVRHDGKKKKAQTLRARAGALAIV
jgi:hypothetical protein